MTEFHFYQTEIRNKKVLSNEALKARRFKKNYDSKASIATIFFTAKYGHPLNKDQMTYVANEITRMNPALKPSFEELRHQPQLTKWFEDHLNEIIPYLGSIQLKPTKKLMIKTALSKKRQKTPLIDKNFFSKSIE